MILFQRYRMTLYHKHVVNGNVSYLYPGLVDLLPVVLVSPRVADHHLPTEAVVRRPTAAPADRLPMEAPGRHPPAEALYRLPSTAADRSPGAAPNRQPDEALDRSAPSAAKVLVRRRLSADLRPLPLQHPFPRVIGFWVNSVRNSCKTTCFSTNPSPHLKRNPCIEMYTRTSSIQKFRIFECIE